MSNKNYLLSFIFCLLFLSSYSQGEFIIEINSTNGSFIKRGPAISGIVYIYPDDRAYDESTGIFIFPSATINHSLYSMNVVNGSIVHNPLIGDINAFQFDNALNILYGIERDQPNNSKFLISINQVTGSFTRIGNSLPNSSVYSGNLSTFNKLNHTYIFLAPPNILYSIDASNGNVISNPTLVLSSGENIINFTIDNSTGILYGLLQDNNLQKGFLVSIDPTTGTNTRIGLGTTFSSTNGSSTIDEANQQYIFMYSDGLGAYAITTLDISTGNLIYNNTITPLTGLDNVFSLKYDNIHGRLYSIHWDDSIEPVQSINDFIGHSIINIFPNPFSSQTILNTDKVLKNATLTLYNSLGMVVRQMINLNGKSITLHRDNLSSGIYWVHLSEDNQTIDNDKLIIIDK
jgi:hypothetical protein